MNITEIKSAAKFLKETSRCTKCDKRFKESEIHVLGSYGLEAYFELRCNKCEISAILSIFFSPTEENCEHHETLREHQGISKNEYLDFKNFLNKFDGNFRKYFSD